LNHFNYRLVTWSQSGSLEMSFLLRSSKKTINKNYLVILAKLSIGHSDRGSIRMTKVIIEKPLILTI